MKFQLAAALAMGLIPAQAQTVAPDMTPLLAYARAQGQVTLPDGRRLALICWGHGTPTVLLMAGINDWSISWGLVQGPIAAKTRTCSWDRPGYGFSDPSPAFQDARQDAADLDAALKAANITGPFILVGHSAGSYDTLAFADAHKRDLAGMVLVEPSLPDQLDRLAAISPKAAGLAALDLTSHAAAFHKCASETGAVFDADPGCSAHIPAYPAPVKAALLALDHDPARMRSKVSLYEQFAASAKAAVDPARNYGNIPLIVLTAEHSPVEGLPVESPDKAQALETLWRHGHDELAALSRRGVNRTVLGSGHHIQLEKPQAVIDAVDAVIDDARH